YSGRYLGRSFLCLQRCNQRASIDDFTEHLFLRQYTSKVLPNDLFEHSSCVASMVIADFLDSLGEVVEDEDSLRMRNDKRFCMSADNDLSLTKLKVYTCYRLVGAGYSLESFKDLWPNQLGLIDDVLTGVGIDGIRLRCEKRLDSRFDTAFKEYINYVGYASMYIVAQFTGMRPGELVRLIGDVCLEQDSQTGFWLIAGKVEKHQQNLTAIFDDYWIAIPIVRDAIRASIILSRLKNNPYIFSRANTVPSGKVPLALGGSGFDYPMNKFFKGFLSEAEVADIDFFPYMLRHTLAFQMRRAGLGLPFISHQLKHFGELVGQVEIGRSFSRTTLSYGEIGEALSTGGRNGSVDWIKREAETEFIKGSFDPDGNYTGPLASEHKASMQKEFSGYMAAGYTKEEVFQFMADQNIAVINVGSALCYGKKSESFDPSLPCIGGLRCNPSRCRQAVVTEAHAPAWKNIYEENKKKLSDPRFEHSYENYKAAMEEARVVLLNLGIEVEE
ncbi:site-specific integrase, partial [Pseudomonas syringae]